MPLMLVALELRTLKVPVLNHESSTPTGGTEAQGGPCLNAMPGTHCSMLGWGSGSPLHIYKSEAAPQPPAEALSDKRDGHLHPCSQGCGERSCSRRGTERPPAIHAGSHLLPQPLLLPLKPSSHFPGPAGSHTFVTVTEHARQPQDSKGSLALLTRGPAGSCGGDGREWPNKTVPCRGQPRSTPQGPLQATRHPRH